MYGKILDFIRQNRLFAPGDRVISALSGGADSICLLVILNELKKELGIELKAVHVHHGLRGAEADRDSNCAEMLSKRLEVPFVCVRADVGAYAKAHGMSVEEAGRQIRYEVFEQERLAFEGNKIAVGHHGDDQAETILYHLFRGTGLKGLGGMRPVRERIVRPLLCAGKEEILDYLKEKGISYCEDSSNYSSRYTRNRIRGGILPLVKEQVNFRAVQNILHAGEMALEADAYLEKQAKRILEAYGILEEGGSRCRIKAGFLLSEDEIIRKYTIRRMIRLVNPSMKDISMVHVEHGNMLLSAPDGKRIDLPGGILLRRDGEDLQVEKGKIGDLAGEEGEPQLPKLDFSIFSYKKGQEIPKNGYTKWFDYDKIKNALCVRYRESGDYFTLAGGGRKTIKAFMIDEKIPAKERGLIPLVADGSHILWVIGYRISEYYKITDHTRNVIQVQSDGGKADGRSDMRVNTRGRGRSEN